MSGFLHHNPESMTTLFSFAFDFARFFVVATIAQIFEGAFLVQFLFQATQSAVDQFTFLKTNFRMHLYSPPSAHVKNFLVI